MNTIQEAGWNTEASKCFGGEQVKSCPNQLVSSNQSLVIGLPMLGTLDKSLLPWFFRFPTVI